MSDQTDCDVTKAIHMPLADPPTPTSQRDKRRQLVDMEYGLRALQLHAAALEEELQSLEGFSLTGLLAGLKGDRNARIEEVRGRLQEVREKYEAGEAAIEVLQTEVDELERQLATGGGDARLRQTAATELPDVGEAPASSSGNLGPPPEARRPNEEQIKLIQRAIEAGEDARKGLLAELETASSLGRCNIIAVRGGLKGLLDGTRDRTRDMLAKQVRCDLRRFLGRYAEAIAAGAPAIPEEQSVQLNLQEAAEKFTGAWLQATPGAHQAADDLVQALALAGMLLEKRLLDVQKKRCQDEIS